MHWFNLRDKLAELMGERCHLHKLDPLSSGSPSSRLFPTTRDESPGEKVSSNSQFSMSSSELYVCPPNADDIHRAMSDIHGVESDAVPSSPLLSHYSVDNDDDDDDNDEDDYVIDNNETLPEGVISSANEGENEPSKSENSKELLR